jgi:hypothetical protein
MEKSFFTFQSAYPEWKCSPSGQTLVDRVEEYKLAAMTRERALHIDAATRQLELLARLEHQTVSPRTNQYQFEAVHLKDSHYHPPPPDAASSADNATYTIPTADAGAGIVRPSVSRPVDRQQHGWRQESLSIPPLHHPVRPTPQLSPTFRSQSISPTDAATIDRPTSDASPSPPSVRSTTSPSTWNPEQSNAFLYHQQQQLALDALPQVSTLFMNQSGMTEDVGMPSLNGSAPIGASSADRTSERQYYWLERFHQHLEKQSEEEQQLRQQQQQPGSFLNARGSTNTFGASLPPPITGDESLESNISRSMPTPASNGGRPPHRGTSQDATSTSSMI